MGSKEVKIDKQLSFADTDNFLKTLGDALAGRPAVDPSALGFDLQDFKKIKMDLKQEGNLCCLKIKVKYTSPASGSSSEDATGQKKYKTLKKQMKASFKVLKTAMEAGSLPSAETVGAFMEQAGLMISYTDRGYGDEYYDEFMKLCSDFKEIFDAGDLQQLTEAFNAIDARKALCHDKYD